MKSPRFSARVIETFMSAGLKQGIQVSAATADTPAQIMLYDEIGYFGIDAKGFLKAMATAGAGPINVHINSPGGDVFDAMAIYNALRAHPGGVTTTVDGIAASAASFIALAGTKMEMAQNSMLMIHNASTMAFGNKNDIRQTADVLDKVDGQIAGMYAAKTGASMTDIGAAMDAETWMTADEAVAAGYCDAITTPPKSTKNETVVPVVAVLTVVEPETISADAVEIFNLRARIAMAAE